MTNPGYVTTHEVVDLIKAERRQRQGLPVLRRRRRNSCSVAAKTPRSNCLLDTTKLQNAGVAMTEVHDAIAQSLRSWVRE